MRFPTDGNWKAAQNGDKFGHIVASKNISLDRDGYVDLAQKAIVLYSLADDAGFGTPRAIVSDNQYAYVVTSDHFFVIDTTATVFSIVEANASNQPTFGAYSDAVIFNGTVVASGDTTVSAIAFGQGQTWPNPKKITSLASAPHPLCVVEHLNQLAVGNGNTVKTYNTSYSLQVTLTLPAEYVVTCIRWRQNQLYIGTRHIYGGDAKVFLWNGSGTSAQSGYTVKGADWVYSMTEFLSSMCAVVSTGQVLRFNGGGFDEIASFPVFYTPYSWTSTAASTSLIGKVASRGMETVGKRLYINIDGSLTNATGVYLPQQPSGLWCFEERKGLYHKAGINYQSKLQLTAAEVSSSYVRFATAHQALTGDPVLCASASGIVGLNSGQVYYAIVDDDATTMTCRLALSPADAHAGEYIVLSGTATTDRFTFDRYESYGQDVIDTIGPICSLRRSRFNVFYGSEVIFGASALDATLTAKGVLMSLGMGRNRGYFITPKIASSAVMDAYKGLRAYFNTLNLDADKILLNYRIRDRFGLAPSLCYSGSATWTSPTTFTINTALKDFKNAAVGDQIEIVKGAGAGYAGVITAIDKATSTYSVTIDTTMPVSSGSFDFIVSNWARLATLTNDSNDNADGFGGNAIGQAGKWVEFKIEMLGRNIALDLLELISSIKQKP